ncbi:MAG: heavy metal-binding domain-containing protein [Pseudomonadota bacterium]
MIELGVVAALTLLGFVFGSIAERRHFTSIRVREPEFAELLMFNERTPPPGECAEAALVGGNVVISVDYFKRLAAGLKSLFGGRLGTYESLVERARREALLRMKAAARARGASLVINVRLETASIAKGGNDQIGSVEVYAYGTALTGRLAGSGEGG